MHETAAKVKKYITENHLISAGNTVICAFSGGADSACMLKVLRLVSEDINFTLVAAHLHHGLRGAEADRDMHFCESFCKMNGIELFCKKVNVKALAKAQKCGEEQAGRTARYAFFDEIAKKYKNPLIATAHTKNDLAETAIHHIIRGSGTKGLSGIKARRGNIIRPVLCLERAETEGFCCDFKIDFVTDSTNLETVYTRNKIRLEILPVMKKINPDAVSAVCRLAEMSASDNDFIEICAENEYNRIVSAENNRCSVDITKLCSLHTALAARIIIKMAQQIGAELDSRHVAAALEAARQTDKTGTKSISLPGAVLKTVYKRIYIEKAGFSDENQPFCHETESGRKVYAGGYEIKFDDKTGVLPQNAQIRVRSRQDGDTIKIRGMTKKLKKLFIDLKIPKDRRNAVPIFEIGGEIMSVIGVADSDNFKKIKDKINFSATKMPEKKHIEREENEHE